ncbi:HNH endonuclease [Candidatus Shapirobacteria bacterium]|nr:HNH endonuclease [Candidatus Shapirobacteria bacterium]MBM3283384.1 HNH endonuclease [Candidatus Gottesmanbacteria bacterium]
MSNRLDHKRIVRQRARFKCENCGKFEFSQYVHIAPESDSGEFDFNNLLHLCYQCHRALEPTLSKGKLKTARINRMKKIKNRPKIDSLVEGLFDELHADTDLVVRLGGGITFINTPRVFEEDPNRYPNPSYLDFMFVGSSLQIDGMLKNENQQPIITFSGTRFTLFTGDFWDVIRQPSRLEIINATKRVSLSLEQNDDLSITIQGNLYLGNSQAIVSIRELILNKYSYFMGNIVENCRVGLRIG